MNRAVNFTKLWTPNKQHQVMCKLKSIKWINNTINLPQVTSTCNDHMKCHFGGKISPSLPITPHRRPLIPIIGCTNLLQQKPLLYGGQYYNFSTSERRSDSALAWMVLKPAVLKFGSMVAGRSCRAWSRSLKPDDRQQIREVIGANWYVIVGFVGFVTLATIVYCARHIETLPVTNRKRYQNYSKEETLQISEMMVDFLQESLREHMRNAKEPESKRVIEVTERLINSNVLLQDADIDKWQLAVIKSDVVNAFALPGGYIFVFDGLLDLTTTQDQLAIVLGHEMAHAALTHGIEGMSLGNLVDKVILACFFAIWWVVPSFFLAILASWACSTAFNFTIRVPHSRMLEWEADQVGLMFAANACYDIREAGPLWRKIAASQEESDDGTSIFPEWMGTHPDSLKRAEFLDSLQTEAAAWREKMGCPPFPQDPPKHRKL